MLRWASPVKNMSRQTANTVFHGEVLHQGEKIVLLFESANLNDTVLDEPNTFSPDRNPNNHIAFAFGTHFCLGNQLARLELVDADQGAAATTRPAPGR